MDQSTYDSLTHAERAVLRRLADGRRPSEIAADLDRSLSTVRNQLHSARTKASSSDSLALARALAAFESDGQISPRQPMPMVPDRRRSDGEGRPTWTISGGLEFREERATFGALSNIPATERPDDRGRERHGLTGSTTAKALAICSIAVLLMMCIALAPAMGDAAQRIADLLFPRNP